MVGCEVVMTTRKLLNSAYYLLLLRPPAERERRRERVEMELNSKQGGRKLCVVVTRVCVCYMSLRARARILSCLLGNKHTVHED